MFDLEKIEMEELENEQKAKVGQILALNPQSEIRYPK